MCIFTFLTYSYCYASPWNGSDADMIEVGMVAYTSGIFIQTFTVALETQYVAIFDTLSYAYLLQYIYHPESYCHLGYTGCLFCCYIFWYRFYCIWLLLCNVPLIWRSKLLVLCHTYIYHLHGPCCCRKDHCKTILPRQTDCMCLHAHRCHILIYCRQSDFGHFKKLNYTTLETKISHNPQ